VQDVPAALLSIAIDLASNQTPDLERLDDQTAGSELVEDILIV